MPITPIATLKALVPVTSHSYSCVRVTALDGNRTRLEATDGTLALTVTTPAEETTDFPIGGPESSPTALVPASSIKALRKATRVTMPIETQAVINGAQMATWQNGWSTVAMQAPDGMFPDLDRVTPSATAPGVQVRLGVELLESLVKAAKGLELESILLTLPGATADKPHEAAVRLDASRGDVKVTGVLMPCRA